MANIKVNGQSWAPTIAKITFLLLTVVLMVTVVYLLRNVLHAIILGALFACLLMPLHSLVLKNVVRLWSWLEKFRKKVPSLKLSNPVEYAARIENSTRWVASLLSVIFVFCIIVVPLTFFVINVAHQGRSTISSALRWIDKEMPKQTKHLIEKYNLDTRLNSISPGLQYSLLGMHQETGENADGNNTPKAENNEEKKSASAGEEVILPGDVKNPSSNGEQNYLDIGQYIAKFTRNVMQMLWKVSLNVLSKAWLTVFNFFIMLFVMFHVFQDGNKIWKYLKSISPLGENEQLRVVQRIKEVSRAICYSIFGTAIIQGLLSMVFFRIVGIPALFWGFILGLCSIIPFVGTGLVWVPAAIYLFLTGEPIKALFIIISCGGCVANIDSIIRPFLMKKGGKTGMSYMVLFFSILGGLQTFGLVGLIYGPLITGITGICLLIFSTQFKKPVTSVASLEADREARKNWFALNVEEDEVDQADDK